MNALFSEHAIANEIKTLATQDWPNDFDFETDEICQNVFAPFIHEQLKKLKAYDETRDLKSNYLFHKHAVDAADDVAKTCINLNLGERVARNMYYATLIHDIGKPELSPEIWDSTEKPTDEIKAIKRSHVDLGREIFAQRFTHIDHPFKTLALDIISHHHERMDGQGKYGIYGENLSYPSRLVCIVEDTDGRRYPRGADKKSDETYNIIKIMEWQAEKCEGAFDPVIYRAYTDMKLREYSDSCQNTLSP